MSGVCSLDGCDNTWKKHRPNGVCEKHYLRMRRHGNYDTCLTGGTPPGKPKPPCTIEGCERPQRTASLCDKHYHRYRIHGDPHFVGKRGPKKAGATKPARADWWPYEFSKHDGAWWRRPTDSNGEWELVAQCHLTRESTLA